ncbi:MAG: hypothetical protein R6V32_07080, partial [Bacteroidales bacterium]
MIVMKFGGTSLGNAERIRSVVRLIGKNENCFVVCSAMSGVTNTLVDIARSWKSGNRQKAAELISGLRNHFSQTCYSLFDDTAAAALSVSSVNNHFDKMQDRLKNSYSHNEENWLLAQGELITSEIVAHYMNNEGIAVSWLNALDFMRTGADDEPSVSDIRRRINEVVGEKPTGRFLTQGYICL